MTDTAKRIQDYAAHSFHTWSRQKGWKAPLLVGGGPHCLDSLMDGVSSESIVKFFMKHQAASANG